MVSSRIRVPEGELRIEREVIPVHYQSDVDRRWRFTDAAGHEHAYAEDFPGSFGDRLRDDRARHYPTLRPLYEAAGYCGRCNDYHDDRDIIVRYECPLCGETIRPGTTGPGTIYIPGMISAYLNDQPISQEEAERIIAARAAAESERKQRADADQIMDMFGIPPGAREPWEDW
jgi:hypothetical protein